MSDRVVSVASPTDVVLATLWRDRLAEEGIPAELGGALMATSVYVMLPQLATIDVLVREEDAPRARALIEGWRGEAADRSGEAGTGPS